MVHSEFYDYPISYTKALNRQNELVQRVKHCQTKLAFLGFECLPTITFGRDFLNQGQDLKYPKDDLLKKYEILSSDRGGRVTAHEPGQLVLFLMFSFPTRAFGPKHLVEILETAILEHLAESGIKGQTVKDLPGVFVGDQKICSIGLRIKDRITRHGLALNVYNSLTIFEAIHPCGSEVAMTSMMHQSTGGGLSIYEIFDNLCQIIKRDLERDYGLTF